MQNSNSHRGILSLASIMAFRILGLFMILPVFSLYAKAIPSATPSLIGIALGIYGLTQALLQIPFGSWSDRIGRKPIIMFGLLLFMLGSLVGAFSQSIYAIILARALQGAGAIGSTVLAFVADLTPDENRSKAMAMIGLIIGFAFTLAMILGPMIGNLYQLSGIFMACAVFAGIGLILLYSAVPDAPKPIFHSRIAPNGLINILKNTALLRLDFGIAVQHAAMTALFVIIPLMLNTIHVSLKQVPLVYLLVTVVAFFLMLPFLIIGEKHRQMKAVFCGAIGLLIVAEGGLLYFHATLYEITTLLLIYFTAFTLLEAFLPSLVSKIAPIQQKGAAMGIYSTSQFLGIFIGGSVGGYCYGHFGISGVLCFCLFLNLGWLLAATSMQEPPYLSTIIFKKPAHFSEILKEKLLHQAGVAELSLAEEEQLLYLKIDKKITNTTVLQKLLEPGNLS